MIAENPRNVPEIQTATLSTKASQSFPYSVALIRLRKFPKSPNPPRNLFGFHSVASPSSDH
jgi:hypothetical protein